jgi:hypothetical protein
MRATIDHGKDLTGIPPKEDDLAPKWNVPQPIVKGSHVVAEGAVDGLQDIAVEQQGLVDLDQQGVLQELGLRTVDRKTADYMAQVEWGPQARLGSDTWQYHGK